jgi:hypothetical protein
VSFDNGRIKHTKINGGWWDELTKKGAVMRSQTSSHIVPPLNKFLSRAMDGMRFCSRALVLSGFIVCAAGARADDNGDSNSANNPVEPRLTLEYWNYYAVSLNQLNGGAENGEGRVLIPYKVDGIQQIFHIDPPIATAPAATSGPRTGLGDTQIYNFSLTTQDIGLPEKVTFGAGPLIAVPTNTSTNFGPNSVQGGLGGVIIAPQSWGLLGVLATYQHTLSGASSELTTVQPNIFYNLANGYYLRSSAIMEFNTYSHTDVVPVGFGAGKVIKLNGGYTLNVYAEAQPSVYRAGVGAPNFQAFTGIQLQFPPSLTSGWKF